MFFVLIKQNCTDGRGVGGRMDTCICTPKSRCCPPEIITTLLVGYTQVQNKKWGGGVETVLKALLLQRNSSELSERLSTRLKSSVWLKSNPFLLLYRLLQRKFRWFAQGQSKRWFFQLSCMDVRDGP